MTEQTVKNADTDAKKLLINDVEFYRYSGADALEEEEGDGIFLGRIKNFALKADRKLTLEEIHRAVKILGYFWKTMVKGNESLSSWTHIDNEIILVNQGLFDDTNNSVLSRSGHPRDRFAQLVMSLNAVMAEGTTLRKHGTRLENGITVPVKFTVWVDEVEQLKDVPEPAPVEDEKEVSSPALSVVRAVAPPWDVEPEDFIAKDAGDLTFNEVKELLEALKVSQKRAKQAEDENAELKETLKSIRTLLK